MDSQSKSVEEQQFLGVIALKLNLTGDPRAAFLARFNPKNANKKNSNCHLKRILIKILQKVP